MDRAQESELTRNSELLDRARAIVEATPEILSGTPVVRGTRVPVHDVGASVIAGIPLSEILEHYPSLTEEQVRLSRVYAEAFPPTPHALRRPPSGAQLIVDRVVPTKRRCGS